MTWELIAGIFLGLTIAALLLVLAIVWHSDFWRHL